uniref:Uncharacterized protein n=1 Tax=Manihot esculenta TaxID=3983 RepID=A0A2C9VAE7_MANES
MNAICLSCLLLKVLCDFIMQTMLCVHLFCFVDMDCIPLRMLGRGKP